jgi:CSLREA domain-containing protein
MRLSFKKTLTAILTLLAWTFSAFGVSPAHAAVSFTVDSTTDAVDTAPGNGVCATAGSVCTLRAAIQEANALAGDDTITVPAGTYTLTILGRDEYAAATGDLNITSNITINGAGAGSTIIQAGTLGVGGPPNGFLLLETETFL